ncbi:MAG: autotransporter assembly complex family protein [Halofilum sp. (in: g-proteobacteria)]|nr:autotransporter assembly complex family protein [Halofilum sp. (in: g-proteobacteria)]
MTRARPTVRRIAALLAGVAVLCWGGPVAAAGVAVEIEGVEGELRDNVRAFLGIVQHEFPPDAAPDARMVRRLHQEAPAEIRRALRPFGYYRPEIEARLESGDEGWRASYRIEPGPPVRLVDVDLRVTGAAADDPAFDELIPSLPLVAGERLHHPDYETAKARLMELAADRGYLEAVWRQNVLRIDIDTLEARASLVLDSGPRYRFGEVRFERTVLGDEFLRRYLRFQPGDPFLAGRLLDLQYALDDSDYFRRVDVRARRADARDGRIPITVELEARPKHRYTFGIGFGTDTGPRVSVGRETRYLNERGHSLRMEAQVAAISTRLSGQYTIPLAQPWRERLELHSSLGDEEIGDGDSRQFELGGQLVTTGGGWQRTLSLDYQRSEDRLGGEVATRNLVMPGLGLVRSRFDDLIYATRGYRLAIDWNGGTETFGSDVSFARLRLGTNGVYRVWDGGRVLGRLQLGKVWVDPFEDLPLSQRFYAGGDQSVRGFAYQSLAPENADGEVIGGRYLAVASLELEQLIAGNWGAAVFVDHGAAVNDLDDDLRTAAGIGLRYRSPVGVFRVDVAQATDGDESPRLHLSLGVNL